MKNTTEGIEFGLAGYLEGGAREYSISSLHKSSETSYSKLGISPEKLIFFVHNHDSGYGSSADYPSGADKNTATSILNKVGQTTSMFPRFFLTRPYGQMTEFYQNEKKTELNKMNIFHIRLDKIKRYDYFKK